MTNEQAIISDLDLCDRGIAMTRGKVRARYVAHRKACLAALHELNVADDMADISDADLLAELGV